MNEEFKNIEQIELFLEGKLSNEESKAFKNRLLIDNELKEEFELYKLTISAIKENDAFILKNKLSELDKELDKTLNSTTTQNKKNIRYLTKKIIGIAASIIIIAGLSLYYFLAQPDNYKLYSKYYIKDKGLPVKMSDNANSLNTVMNYYKLGETEKALTEISNFTENDTTRFYKAVFLMELKKYDEAEKLFNKLSDKSNFKQKADYYLALIYLHNNKKQESKKILQKIVDSKNNIFKNKAKSLLSEKYYK